MFIRAVVYAISCSQIELIGIAIRGLVASWHPKTYCSWVETSHVTPTVEAILIFEVIVFAKSFCKAHFFFFHLFGSPKNKVISSSTYTTRPCGLKES